MSEDKLEYGMDLEPHPKQDSGTFLFTGCPRSGTKSVAYYYRDQGLDIGHEQSGRDGTVEWRHAYNSDPQFKMVIVVVRDPIRTVISLTELLTNVDRNSFTWHHIKDLSTKGYFHDLLTTEDYVGAAIQWWTSVYDRLEGLPTIHTDRFEALPHENARIKNAPPFVPTIDTEKFFEVAYNYGYEYVGIK